MHDDDRIDEESESASAVRRVIGRRMVAMMAARGITIPDPESAEAARQHELEALVGPERAQELLAMVRQQARLIARRILPGPPESQERVGR